MACIVYQYNTVPIQPRTPQVTLGLQPCWDAGVKLVVVAGQKLQSAGVIVDMFPLHNQEKLKSLCEAWYAGNQLSQPLGEGMHMENLKAQQMLACFCFCVLLGAQLNLVSTHTRHCTALSRFSQRVFRKPFGLLLQFLGFLHLVSASTGSVGPGHHILLW